MPRRPRIIVPHIPLHVIQRGNNRQRCFFNDQDCQSYLSWLAQYADTADCLVHAYVLMPNHVHLLLTPARADSAGDLMKRLGQRYVQYVNRSYKRSGTLWEGRFRSCVIEQQTYLFNCQRYIEMNPVRAGIVKHPGEYRWSSYQVNGLGEKSDLISPHILYQNLGKTVAERLKAYIALFDHELEIEELNRIREATNGNFSLGDKQFQKEISTVLGRRVTKGSPGRPRTKKVIENSK
jgi:putative transposase